MASTTAMFSGLSGLNTNSRRLEVIGNNISNVNTTAFKSNRMLFSPQLQRNLTLGAAPTANGGGANPSQIGLGVGIAATQRNFITGGTSTTGIASDLAIEGDGFFIVERNGTQFYTRDGSFQFNAVNDLVTSAGARVRGYGVDANFQIVEGQLIDLNIPLGSLSLAEATRNVEFSGNLNADGLQPTTGSVFTFPQIQAGGANITGTELLTALDPPGTYVVGDQITLSGAERGGKIIPDATFTIEATSTVNELLGWMQDVLGVVPGASAGDNAGWSIVGGEIRFEGNFGELNDLRLAAENIVFNPAGGGTPPNLFVPTKTASADGESVRTTFTIFDSLGTPINVDLTVVLNSKDTTGTQWRTFAHSQADTDLASHLEVGDRNGTFTQMVPALAFDNFGKLIDTTPVAIELDRLDTGASDPLNFTLSFDSQGSNVTAFASPEGAAGSSVLAATFQDGSPLGTLSTFSVGENGIITGGFTNGLTRTLGQVAMAKFTNPEGLVDSGGNLFRVGPNSGTPLITTPLGFGTGRIIGGALELSNVDLSQEFINMILTSTGYSASSRVITTSDQLLQQLIAIAR